jgi:hypothetical protein
MRLITFEHGHKCMEMEAYPGDGAEVTLRSEFDAIKPDTRGRYFVRIKLDEQEVGELIEFLMDLTELIREVPNVR